MFIKPIFENFFDDLDDGQIQINNNEMKVQSRIDFNDEKWPVFIIFYLDGQDNKSGVNIKKMGKFIMSKFQSSSIVEDCSDLYITDNSDDIMKPEYNCTLAEFDGNMKPFAKYGFRLCAGIVPNKRGTIKQAYELVIGILNQAQTFIDNILETELSCDSVTLMNHEDERQYICSWDADINNTKSRFFLCFDVIRILVPNMDEMTAFKQFRNYLESRGMYKKSEILYMENLRNSNRGYRFYDLIVKGGECVSVNKTQWNKFTKYVKYLTAFDNLTGNVCKSYSLIHGFPERAPNVYNFINNCISKGMTITTKVIIFLRGKDKKYIHFLYYIDDVLFDDNTYKSIVFKVRTYPEITYMLAASLYHMTILNIEPYEVLESIKGICSMDEKDYNSTKTYLESYINGTETVPNI